MRDDTPPLRVLFDVMDTLVVDPFYRGFAGFFGMEFDELLGQLHPTTWVEFERGELSEEQARSRFFADGRAMDWEGLKAFLRREYRLVDGMEGLLAELQGASVEMHVLSNYPVWYHMIEEKLRLSRYLQWSFLSCEMGVRKPTTEIYRRAAARLGVAPERCVFIDDREANCEGARAAGMAAIHFTDATGVREELVNHGVGLSRLQS